MEKATFCVGCRHGSNCDQDKDACVSKRLLVLAMGFADHSGIEDRIEGRVLDLVVRTSGAIAL